MALYFFNIAGAIYDPDVEGVELASMGDARVMAAQRAGELLRDRPGAVWAGEELRIDTARVTRLRGTPEGVDVPPLLLLLPLKRRRTGTVCRFS